MSSRVQPWRLVQSLFTEWCGKAVRVGDATEGTHQTGANLKTRSASIVGRRDMCGRCVGKRGAAHRETMVENSTMCKSKSKIKMMKMTLRLLAF